MKRLVWFAGAVIAITALRLFVQAGLVLIVLMLLVCLIRSPFETLKALAGLILIASLASYPGLGFALVTLLIATNALIIAYGC